MITSIGISKDESATITFIAVPIPKSVTRDTNNVSTPFLRAIDLSDFVVARINFIIANRNTL